MRLNKKQAKAEKIRLEMEKAARIVALQAPAIAIFGSVTDLLEAGDFAAARALLKKAALTVHQDVVHTHAGAAFWNHPKSQDFKTYLQSVNVKNL